MPVRLLRRCRKGSATQRVSGCTWASSEGRKPGAHLGPSVSAVERQTVLLEFALVPFGLVLVQVAVEQLEVERAVAEQVVCDGRDGQTSCP